MVADNPLVLTFSRTPGMILIDRRKRRPISLSPCEGTSMTLKERLYQILENPDPTDAVAHRWNVVLAAAIVLNLIAVMLETVDAIAVQYRDVLRWVEIL